MARTPAPCRWISFQDALNAFVQNVSGHQGSGHIKPLHWYVACRLVLEGGFRPDDITPRPPFEIRPRGSRLSLEHVPESGRAGERTILGGLKTKNVDVVVTKNGIGPVLAVSMKGTLNAFRNLTNRMEEAVGDCTNLHISYPALVYGFLQVMRANRASEGVAPNDIAICQNGTIADTISRYHDIMARLSGRDDVRSETTRYEAVALVLADTEPSRAGEVVESFPPEGSPLCVRGFFESLYRQYDQRFVYAAPGLESVTRRLAWAAESPAFAGGVPVDFRPRLDLAVT
ncbi:MAG: hypothetical protein GXY83_07655 [Rhodopirellula sp.]|nr:hypothetical protein [Rhodopirellula sp.]